MQPLTDALTSKALFFLLAKKLTLDLSVAETVDTIDQLHTLYAKLTSIEGVLAPSEEPEVFEELSENGTRVNPYMAAYCFRDYLRTYKFVYGINKAVAGLITAGREIPLQILYAGSGPYAALVLPLTALYEKHQIKVTLIDIHQSSLDAVKMLVNTFAIGEYFTDFIKIDATCYEPASEQLFDVIISETMDKSLRKEPQVAIFNNLCQFLAPGGILIPEEIRVDLYQSDWGNERNPKYEYYSDEETREYNSAHRKKVTNLITINKDTVQYFKRTGVSTNIFLTKVEANQLEPLKYSALLLLTEVQVYGQTTLIEDESILTEKDYISPLNEKVIQQDLSFYYKMDNDPRIVLG